MLGSSDKKMELENINPNVFKKSDERQILSSELDENIVDLIDSREVFGKYFVVSILFLYNK